MLYVYTTGYVDTTEEALCEALQTCLSVYNVGTSQKLELVFFKDAIRHAARLSRVLVGIYNLTDIMFRRQCVINGEKVQNKLIYFFKSVISKLE